MSQTPAPQLQNREHQEYLELLMRENADLKADLRLIATTVKSTLTALGFMDAATGELKADPRAMVRLMPLALNGTLSEKLSFLGDLAPLLDKYKHLAE
jgi:hypothetical protein